MPSSTLASHSFASASWKAHLVSASKDKTVGKAATDYLDFLKELRKFLDKNGARDEPINVIAHSQGTMLTLFALSRGAALNDVVLLNSPLDKSKAKAELQSIVNPQQTVKTLRSINYYYNIKDTWAGLIAYGGYWEGVEKNWIGGGGWNIIVKQQNLANVLAPGHGGSIHTALTIRYYSHDIHQSKSVLTPDKIKLLDEAIKKYYPQVTPGYDLAGRLRQK